APARGAPSRRCGRRTTAAAVSNSTPWTGTPWRSAASRQAARRLGSRPVVSITVVSRRGEPLGDDEVEDLERVTARALVALARTDHRAQPVRGHDLVGGEPLPRPV